MFIKSIGGDVKAENRFGGIELVNGNKYVELRTRNGSINYISDNIIEKGVRIENEYGNINMQIPGEQQGQYKASTRYGKIYEDFPLSVNKETNYEYIDVKVGDDTVKFDITNKNGDVKISSH
jgi:hypothetical protein